MRILWLSPYPPWEPLHGGRIRLRGLLRAAARVGHDVEVWSVDNVESEATYDPELGVRIRTFAADSQGDESGYTATIATRWPEAVRGATSTQLRAALHSPSRARYDIAILEQAHMAAYAPDLRRTNLPFVLDAQNVEAVLTRQMARFAQRQRTRVRLRHEARRFARVERRLFREAVRVIATSQADKARILAAAPAAKVSVIPSPVDTEYFYFVDHTVPLGRKLVMTGTLGYRPNLDAAFWMRDEVMPRLERKLPSVALDLVGAGPPEVLQSAKFAERGINVVGAVPDVRPYMHDADLFVIPLRMGSGTRLKAVEALASGLPIVSTRLGVEGLDMHHEIHACISDDPEAFAASVARTLTQPRFRATLIRNGMSLVAERFAAQRVTDLMADVLDQVQSVVRIQPQG